MGMIGAYHLAYGKKKDKVFTIGVKYGAHSTSFRNADINSYQDTYGILNPMGGFSADLAGLQSRIATENNGTERSASDLSVGLMLTAPMGKSSDLRLGIAMDRILNPMARANQQAEQDTTGSGGIPVLPANLRFGRRVNGFISFYNSISNKLVFNPNLVVQRLGSSTNILMQGLFKYLIKPEKNMTLSFGAGLRLVNSTDIPLYLGVDVNSWKVGLSYDTNIAGLRPSNNTFGALEIGISKVFSWKKDPVVEPIFICPRL